MTESKKKPTYALHPGPLLVPSKKYYDNFNELRLRAAYQLPVEDCVLWKDGMEPNDYIHLYPDHSHKWIKPTTKGLMKTPELPPLLGNGPAPDAPKAPPVAEGKVIPPKAIEEMAEEKAKSKEAPKKRGRKAKSE